MSNKKFLDTIFNPDKYPGVWSYFDYEEVWSVQNFLEFDLNKLRENPLLNPRDREIATKRIAKFRENYENLKTAKAPQRDNFEKERTNRPAVSLAYSVYEKYKDSSIITEVVVEQQESLKRAYVLDIPISFYFSNIIPSASFVAFSVHNGLRKLSDVKSSHFDEFETIQGVTTYELNQVKREVSEYQELCKKSVAFNENDQNGIFYLTELPLKYIFYTHRKANIFITYLDNQGIADVISLMNFDFSTKISRIFVKESLEFKETFFNFLLKHSEVKHNLKNFINSEGYNCNLPLSVFVDTESIMTSFLNRNIRIVSDLFRKALTVAEVFYLLQEHKSLLSSITYIEGSENGYIRIENLPMSFIFKHQQKGKIFIDYLDTLGKTEVKHLFGFDFLVKIRGINKSEMITFEHQFLEKIKPFSYPYIKFESYFQIPQSLGALEIFEISKEPNKLKSLAIRGIKTLNDLKLHHITPYELHFLLPLIKKLSNDPFGQFRTDLQMITNKHKELLQLRARGYSLREIGEMHNVTRERVRQIEKKASKKMSKSVDLIGVMLLFHHQGSFTNNDLRAYLEQSEIELFSAASRYSGKIAYITWAQAYFAPGTIQNFEKLDHIVETWIGDGAILSEVIEDIRNELIQTGLDCITEEQFYDYLNKCDYHRYGDIVAKTSTAFSVLVGNIIRNHFPYGVKLSDRTEDSEVWKLRKQLKDEYHYTVDNSDDRLFIARVLRVKDIILWDRSTYIHIDNVEISRPLFQDIANKISESSSSIQFSRLFEDYKAQLMIRTNITTKEGLHGVLKYLHPEFTYRIGWVAPENAETLSLSQQIQNYIETTGGPVSIEDLVNIFGVKIYTIEQHLDRFDGVLKWGRDLYQSVNHLENLTEHKSMFLEVLNQLLDITGGYTSIYKYHLELKIAHLNILNTLAIDNIQALFSLSKYLFGDEYVFYGGIHIATHSFPIKDLSIKRVIPYLLRKERKFSGDQYRKMMDRLGFSATNYETPLMAGEGIVQLSKDEFTFLEELNISSENKIAINNEILSLLGEKRFIALGRIQDDKYNRFPDVGLNWNCFLLTSIIRTFSSEMSVKLIEPEYKTLENCSAFIVRSDEEVETYPELLKLVLHQEGRRIIKEAEVEDFMMSRGLLLTSRIPQEILSSKWIERSDS